MACVTVPTIGDVFLTAASRSDPLQWLNQPIVCSFSENLHLQERPARKHKYSYLPGTITTTYK